MRTLYVVLARERGADWPMTYGPFGTRDEALDWGAAVVRVQPQWEVLVAPLLGSSGAVQD